MSTRTLLNHHRAAQTSVEVLRYLGRAVKRLKAKGLANTTRYVLHVAHDWILSSLVDLRFGGRICRTNLDESVYKDGRHTMVHSGYHVLRDIFAHVLISDRDVLVDVGCGEGRVINFWLSRGLKNPIIGLEFMDSIARAAKARYRRYPNVAIVQGDAIANMPRNGTIFFLYNPFSAETVASFESVARTLDATIIYYNNNYMDAFENGHWDVKPVASGNRVYEFRAAVMTRRAA